MTNLLLEAWASFRTATTPEGVGRGALTVGLVALVGVALVGLARAAR